MPRTVPADNESVGLRDLIDQVAGGELVHRTRDGRLAAVVLSRDAYDKLLSAVSADVRRELGEIVEQSRREVAAAELDVAVVDEAIAAVRNR